MALLINDSEVILAEIELIRDAVIATTNVLEEMQTGNSERHSKVIDKLDSIEASVASSNTLLQKLILLESVLDSLRQDIVNLSSDTQSTMANVEERLAIKIESESKTTFEGITDGIASIINILDSGTLKKVAGWVTRIFKK